MNPVDLTIFLVILHKKILNHSEQIQNTDEEYYEFVSKVLKLYRKLKQSTSNALNINHKNASLLN